MRIVPRRKWGGGLVPPSCLTSTSPGPQCRGCVADDGVVDAGITGKVVVAIPAVAAVILLATSCSDTTSCMARWRISPANVAQQAWRATVLRRCRWCRGPRRERTAATSVGQGHRVGARHSLWNPRRPSPIGWCPTSSLSWPRHKGDHRGRGVRYDQAVASPGRTWPIERGRHRDACWTAAWPTRHAVLRALRLETEWPARRLVDDRWVWLPTLPSRAGIHPSAPARTGGHDMLGVTPDLDPIITRSAGATKIWLADGSAARIVLADTTRLLERRGIPDEAIDPRRGTAAGAGHAGDVGGHST